MRLAKLSINHSIGRTLTADAYPLVRKIMSEKNWYTLARTEVADSATGAAAVPAAAPRCVSYMGNR